MSDLTNVHNSTAILSEIVQTLLVLPAAHTVGWNRKTDSKKQNNKSNTGYLQHRIVIHHYGYHTNVREKTVDRK